MGRLRPWGRRGKKKIEEIDGIGREPFQISATTEEVLVRIGADLCSQMFVFSDKGSPIRWPRY